MSAKRIVCLMGPTASGKTAMAMALVKRYPFEIISVDSALVYRGLDIGAAKPTMEELAEAPHRLISFLDPAEPYSVARFRQDAINEINAVWQRGNIPLLVGGTMLYFRALLLGLSDIPSADPEMRRKIDTLAATHGWDYVHQALAKFDPASAERLSPTDTQRVQRALEVCWLSGRRFSDFQDQVDDHKTQQPRYAEDIGAAPVQLAIMPQVRAVLHQRIEQRFEVMLQTGFVDEVRRLYERGDLSVDKPAVRAVGYRQVWSFLADELSYDEMRYRGIVATRQLAKRQLTWLRHWVGLTTFETDANCRYQITSDGEQKPLIEAISSHLIQQSLF